MIEPIWLSFGALRDRIPFKQEGPSGTWKSLNFIIVYDMSRFWRSYRVLPSSHLLWDANLTPIRISKTLLEDALDVLNLLLCVARMSLGALGPLLGCSWLALASLLIAFELVLSA